MKKLSVLALLSAAVVFQFCSSSKKASSSSNTTASVTYTKNIQPIILSHCTPCHIEGKGKKKSLNNYAAAKSSIDEILERIQKNPGEHGFMPARHPKLSDSTIQAFIQWKNSGLIE